MIDKLISSEFETALEAEHALVSEHFYLTDIKGLWRSDDGLTDAVIKQRFSDLRFYIVLFA